MDMTAFRSTLIDNLESCHKNTSDGSFQSKMESFNKCLTDTLDSFAPVQSILMKTNETEQPKWFDAEYRKERRERRRLEKLYKRLNTDDVLQEYVKQRDHCVNLANIKQREFY